MKQISNKTRIKRANDIVEKIRLRDILKGQGAISYLDYLKDILFFQEQLYNLFKVTVPKRCKKSRKKRWRDNPNKDENK